MPEIRPFAGITYRVDDDALARVLAPPYDVITADMQERLYAADPRNVVRVVLSRAGGDAGYAEAGATFREWLETGVLAADRRPALDLEVKRDGGATIVVRVLLFWGHALALAIEVPPGADVRLARTVAASFAPPPKPRP